MYLFPTRNSVTAAALAMTNVVPSNAIERTDEAPKVGRGAVTVTGPYTGDADAVIDVEIVDTVIDGAPSPSAPTSTAVGNGTLTGIVADDSWDADVITSTLEDLGTLTRLGQAPFQGLLLEALDPESNPIVAIARNLTQERTEFVVRETIAADTDLLTEEHFNFGAVALSDGNIPANAPRLRFGIDPQIYWHYRKFNYDRARWEYGLSPRPVRPIPAGAIVWAISGTYEIAITDEDADSEAFAEIVTFYDAAVAIRDNSQLVRVIGAIGYDRRPGGSAATDLSINTSSYCTDIIRDGSEVCRQADIGLEVGATAPTETLTITNAGGVDWDVRGDVQGTLPRAVTNALYDAGGYRFRIPAPPPSQGGAQIFVNFYPVLRSSEEPTPQLCLDDARLGINARNGKWRFVYHLKPTAPCDCTDYNIDSPPSAECLGIVYLEGTPVTQAALKRRVERVMQWHEQFTRDQTPLFSAKSLDIRYADRQANYAIKCAEQVCTKGQLDFAGWVASKVYAADVQIAVGGYRYATSGGTAGVSTPTWNTTVGSLTDDNGMKWENLGKLPLPAWDEFFKRIVGEASYLRLDRGSAWSAGDYAAIPSTIDAGQIYQPSTINNHTYYAETGGSTVGTEPSPWPTDGSTVTVGDVVWRDRGAYWMPGHAYALDDRIVIPGHGAYVNVGAGESGASQPQWTGEYGRQIEDGAALWELVSDRSQFTGPNLANEVANDHYRRTETAANAVLATAGLIGNFKSSSTGDRCWTPDLTKAGAFFFEGSGEDVDYVEVYEGRYYVASKPGRDENGNLGVYSTREFSFPAAVSCPDLLKEGDAFEVITRGITSASGGYQHGDQFAALITHATPLRLAGGQIGNDTLTWSIIAGTRGRLPDYRLVTTNVVGYNQPWAAGAVLPAGTLVHPAVANGYCYRSSNAGTAGGSAPVWPTTIDATVDDNGITWTCEAVDPGLSFLITPGGIAFSLRDRFAFSFEGGHAQYRINGGAWSAPFPITSSVALVDGLVANFAGGRPPSWATGDRWTSLARALNGVDNLRSPDDTRARWAGSTQMTITPAAPLQAGAVLVLLEHGIDAGANVVMSGSDDDFATTVFSQALAWDGRSIAIELPAICAAYRIAVDQSGSAQWLYIEKPLRLATTNGARELGRLSKRFALPSRQARGGMGGTIQHDGVSQESFDQLLAGLAGACELHGRRIGVLPNPAEASAAIVRYVDDSLDVDDELGFQPRDTARRWMKFGLALEAVA